MFICYRLVNKAKDTQERQFTSSLFFFFLFETRKKQKNKKNNPTSLIFLVSDTELGT